MPGEQVGSAYVPITLDTSALDSGLNAAKKSVEAATTDMGNMGSKITAGLKGHLEKGKGDFSSVGKDLGNSLTQGLEQRFGAVGGAAGSLAAALGPVGIAAGAVAVGIGLLVASSVTVASSFQSAMSSVNAVLGGTKEDLATLSAAAREAGATTAFSATQGAQALGALASAGFTVSESTTALTATLNLAGAGGMELERAAQMLTTDLSVFSLKAGDAARVTDILATAANKSNSGVGEMGDALAKVGGTAYSMGMNIEQTTAVLETLAGQGIKAAEAGTQLNGILGALNQASSSMATTNQVNAMKEMGITADQINPNLHTQAEIFGLLNEKQMSSTQSLAMFGLTNNASASYITENAAKIGEYESQLTACDGAASAMSDTMNDNLSGAMKEMSSAVEEAQISIGILLLPALTSIVQGATGVVASATNMGKAFGSLITNSTAFQAVSAAISSMGDVVRTTFGNFVSLVKPAWDALGGGSTVMAILQKAFNALTAPITLAFTALSTVVSILGKVASAVSPVASAIGGSLATAIKTTSAYVKAFLEAFSNLGPIKALNSAVQGAADIAGKVWDGLSTAVPKAFSAAFDAVKTLITGFISWVGDVLGVGDIGEKITTGIKDSLGKGITGWIGSISGRAEELLDAGKDIAEPVAEGMKTDEELQKAAAEALQTPEALKAAEEAGGEIADKTLSGFAQQAAMSGLSSMQMLGFINSQSDDTKIKEYVYDLKGKVVKYWYDASGDGPRIAKLSIDDVFMTSGQQDWLNGEAVGYAPTAEQLLAKIGLSDKIISQMKPLAQAKVTKAVTDIKKMFEEETKGTFDLSPAIKNFDIFAPQLESGFKSLMASVAANMSAYGKPKMQATGQAFIDAIASPFSLSNLGTITNALGTLKTQMGKGTEDIFTINKADQEIAAYKAALVDGISDMGPYVSREMGRIGEEATAAIEDGFLSLDDEILLDSLLIQAAILKEVAPAEYEAVGGDVVVALVEGIKDGDIAGPAAAKAQEGIDAIKATLAEGASLENYGALGEQYYNLAKAMGSKWTRGMQEDAEASMAEYKENLGGAITDIQAFAEDGMALAGGIASKAFSDHVFTDDDLVSLQTNLLPILEMVEEKSPEYFESAAGKAWLAFEEAIKSGDPDEIVKKFNDLGQDSGDGFLAGVKKSVSLKEIYDAIKLDPSKLRTLIANPYKYAWTEGIDGAKKEIDARRAEFDEGIFNEEAIKANILNAFLPLKDVLPGWVNGLTTQLDEGKISVAAYLAEFERNYEVLEKYRKSLEENTKGTDKHTTSTEKSTKATQDKTAALKENKDALFALNDEMRSTKELSGAGLTITFSPARVIADDAKHALILGAQIGSKFLTDGGGAVKIGFDQWGREVAVIGRVAQEKWAKSGELISANIKTSSDSAAKTTKDAARDGKGIHIAGMTDGNALFLQGTKDVNIENEKSSKKTANTFGDIISGAASGLAGALGLSANQMKYITDLAGTKFKLDVGGASTDLSTKVRSSITDWTTRYSITSTNEQAKLIVAGQGVRGSLTAGGNSIFNSAVSGGNALLGGANTGATALRNAANSIGDVMSRYSRYDPWKYHAAGTKTTGPQMAVIGEDGPANPEYVIPTKTKRWDLLRAAMHDYGIPGYAGGFATVSQPTFATVSQPPLATVSQTLSPVGGTGQSSGGGAPSEGGDAPPMSATFGITGLAAMAKQVKKIITDLKDFFRISWGIVKSEASTYWKQINAVLTTEITLVRDMGWQAALDIRNSWLEMSKAITDDAKASWQGYWTAIEPSITSLKGSLIGAFQEAGAGMKDAIDNMVLNSESSLQAFEASWSEIWGQLVTDMTDAQAKISEGVDQIAAELQKISVNVNISVGGGGYGGGSGGGFPGDWGFGGPDDWLAPTGDWGTEQWSNYGSACGQSYMEAVRSSTGSQATAGLGYTGGSSYGGGYSSYTPSYTPPSMTSPYYFFAKGALVEKPTEAIIGDAGPEMVLPAKLTRMFTSLADMGFSAAGTKSADKIVIEDHTEHHWYMDGKEVTNQVMQNVQKRLQLRGAVPAR